MSDFLRFVFPFAPESREKALAREILARMKGGEGSGNFGHAGRPGEVGGSGPGYAGNIINHDTAAEKYQSWGNSLSSDQEKALDAYVGSKYSAINDYLRRPEKYIDEDGDPLPGLERAIKISNEYTPIIDDALNSSKVPAGTILYRKMGNAGNDLDIGDEFIDKGFVSTSLETDYINKHFDGKLARIIVAGDVPGGYLGVPDKLFSNRQEAEMLLGRNLIFTVIENNSDTMTLEVRQ